MRISLGGMIRGGFLSAEGRKELVRLARDGSAEHRVGRRANAILLLDDGLSCERVAEVLYLDDDTVRGWRKLYDERGIAGIERFDAGGSSSRLSTEQEEALKAYVAEALPRTTRQVGAFIEREFGIVYESRAGLIALLHRLGLEYHKPEVIGRKLNTEKQQAFIAAYEKLQNSLGPDEAVLFVDAVHPTHAARPVGCWAPKEDNLAIEQTSGRQRINIHGALNLETGETRMIEAETIDAASTIRLLEALETLYPLLAVIHVFLDNARYHHARLVQDWLAQPGRRIRLHFIPAYCPHLNPVERLWGAMHKHVTHNKCYATSREFAEEALTFLREDVPRNWQELCDSVTDNFRVINPKDFRVLA
jgi:transposase